MKFSIFLAAFFTMLAGCAGSYHVVNAGSYNVVEAKQSVVEENTDAKIFASYAGYSGGIVTQPTDAEVAQAVQFGSAAKENSSAVKDVYLSKAKTSAVALEAFYISVRTPLYLISRHAMERAREHRAPDPKFIAFARQLGFVKLAVSQQYISLATWHAYAIARELSLLRDGVRVEPATSIPAWNGVDPFFDPADPLVSWHSTTWLKHSVENMHMQSLRQDQEIAAMSSAYGQNTRPANSVVVQPGDAIFPVEELRKPGRYEIVFRKPHVRALWAKSNPEVRIPISFDKFR